MANCDVWRGQVAAGLASLMRGLHALSKDAARERALLLSWAAVGRMSSANLDEAWQTVDEAAAIAERLDDPAVLGRVLVGKTYCQRLSCQYEAAARTAEKGLHLLQTGSLWDRADHLVSVVYSAYYLGRFATCEERLPELEAVAGRAGHHGALWAHERVQHGIETARTGDIRRQLGYSAQALSGPTFRYISRTSAGVCGLYLGLVDQALEQFATVGADQPADHFLQGMPEANLFAAAALAGQIDRAQALIPTVVQWLPVSGRRNIQGSFFALEAFATGLALIGERDRCGALYPLTLDYIQTGQAVSASTVGPSNPQLAAALAADAAGLVDQSREHFETALRQAREVPIRILQPTVLYWYGRSLSAATDSAERLRGRAMVEAALTDFRALEMVLHANLAEQFLRAGH